MSDEAQKEREMLIEIARLNVMYEKAQQQVAQQAATIGCMIEALKSALPALDEGQNYQGEILDVVDQVRDAIEKAEQYDRAR